MRFSRYKGCEITEVICLIYVLTCLPRPFTSSLFLLLPVIPQQIFPLFFFFFKSKTAVAARLWILTKIRSTRNDPMRIRFFRFFFYFGIHATLEWRKFASPRSPNMCVNVRNPSANSTPAKVGRDIILWTRRSDGNDKRNVGRMRSVARSLTIISPVTSWKNNSSHRDREATI